MEAMVFNIRVRVVGKGPDREIQVEKVEKVEVVEAASVKKKECSDSSTPVEPAAVLPVDDRQLDTAVISRVIDGNTIEVDLNGDKVDVRLLLVDTPEIYEGTEKLGPAASAFARRMLTGQQVQLEYDGQKYDQYGRIFAYVWINGQMFNQMLLEEGLAHVACVYNPPYKYYQAYVRAQERTKALKKGIWRME